MTTTTTRSERTGRRGRAVAVGLALLLATGVALVTGLSSGSTDGSSDVAYDAGSGALSFSLQTFEGETLDSADLLGTPVVLNGYASWCALCLREMPDFERVHRAAGSKVAVIGFNPQSNDNDAAQAQMVADTGISYPTVRDPDDRLLREFNPTGGLPVTVFVDAQGVVRKVHRGLLTEQLLRDEVRDVLGVEL